MMEGKREAEGEDKVEVKRARVGEDEERAPALPATAADDDDDEHEQHLARIYRVSLIYSFDRIIEHCLSKGGVKFDNLQKLLLGLGILDSIVDKSIPELTDHPILQAYAHELSVEMQTSSWSSEKKNAVAINIILQRVPLGRLNDLFLGNEEYVAAESHETVVKFLMKHVSIAKLVQIFPWKISLSCDLIPICDPDPEDIDRGWYPNFDSHMNWLYDQLTDSLNVANFGQFLNAMGQSCSRVKRSGRIYLFSYFGFRPS